MSYPIAPLTFSWGTTYQNQERVNSGRFDDGVELFERAGINRRSQSIDVSINVVDPREIDTFFRELRGKPFRLNELNRLQGEDLTFICSEWEIPEVSRGCWLFKAKFTQVRRFEKKTTKFISLSLSKTMVLSGEKAMVTIGLSGYPTIPSIQWSVTSGPGSIVQSTFNQAEYTLPSDYFGGSDTATILAYLPDDNRQASIEIQTLSRPIVYSVTISPETSTFEGGLLNLTANVYSSGASTNVNWTIQGFSCVLTNVRSNSVTALIPRNQQSVIVRATSVADTTKWAESVITVLAPSTISRIDATATPNLVQFNSVVELSATAFGSGNFETKIDWSIVSGSGQMTQLPGEPQNARYTSASIAETVVLRATSVGNPLVVKDLGITVLGPVPTITSIVASSTPVKAEGSGQLTAVVSGAGSFSSQVTWTIQPQSTAIGTISILNGVVTYSAPSDSTGLLAILRATSTQDPTKFGEVTITIEPVEPAIPTIESLIEITTQINREMLISEVFIVLANNFTLQQTSGLYHAVYSLTKVDGSKGVQLVLTDNDGDDQGLAQIISPYNGDYQKIAVELTASQLASNSYPLSFLCQGRKLLPTV